VGGSGYGQNIPRDMGYCAGLARRVCDLLTPWGPVGIDAVAAEGRLAVQASGMPLDGEDAGGLSTGRTEGPVKGTRLGAATVRERGLRAPSGSERD
jgi:hypothetical protein